MGISLGSSTIYHQHQCSCGASYLFALDIYHFLNHFTLECYNFFLTHSMLKRSSLFVCGRQRTMLRLGVSWELSKSTVMWVKQGKGCKQGCASCRSKSIENVHMTTWSTDHFWKETMKKQFHLTPRIENGTQRCGWKCLSALSNTGSRKTLVCLFSILQQNLFLPSLLRLKGL